MVVRLSNVTAQLLNTTNICFFMIEKRMGRATKKKKKKKNGGNVLAPWHSRWDWNAYHPAPTPTPLLPHAVKNVILKEFFMGHFVKSFTENW